MTLHDRFNHSQALGLTIPRHVLSFKKEAPRVRGFFFLLSIRLFSCVVVEMPECLIRLLRHFAKCLLEIHHHQNYF